MTWFVEIFSDKSDLARLVSILISAIVAILVVLLNQWILSRRARKELLIGKVEELFSASNEYIAACRDLLDTLQRNGLKNLDKSYEYSTETVYKLNGSISTMQMICGLYFRSEDFSPDDYHISRMPILEIAHRRKSLPAGEAFVAYQESKNHIENSKTQLDNLCKRLMKKYG
ncbi:hypothetical protein [Alteromonas ponticola]|uniref:DUF4760 domain-containing protein n=1 Tax=Alteromonas ponticola TaxID=2720613 RepID=A0ABX1QXX9_9ALTE|nr:hypothetical protein [Alteromonas ponticola]NMH58704.1 hypothetical protein [Alteromonas ponticola]